MIDLDFSFEQSPWEAAFESLQKGGSISAMRFLTLLEGESEDAVQEALLDLEMKEVTLDVSDLPKAPGTGEAAVRLRREEQLVKKGLKPTDLEENDPLRLYLEEVAALPAAGDVQRMAERYASGYEQVLPGITNLMLSTVISLAEEMTGKGVLLMDLIQEGSMGLWQGILSYRSGDFETHARWWIRQYLAKAVTLQAREMGLGQRMKQMMEDYRAVDDRLLTDLGRNPTLEEIALEMHITPEEAEAVSSMVDSARLLQKAEKEIECKEEPEDEQHVEDTAYFQSRQRIEELLSVLPEKEAELLQLRFGLEGGLPMSPEDVGKRLGMTPEEVVAMEAAALEKLRNEK